LEAFVNMPLRSACFTDEAFIWYIAELPVLGLLSSSAGLSGFPHYQMMEFSYIKIRCKFVVKQLTSIYP
jgi:hypothetical protein